VYPQSVPPQLDVLLVVDDTTAMTPYAARTPEIASAAASALDMLGPAFGNIQVAVTTNGGVVSTVLSDHVDWFGVHTRNFDGTLESNLASLVDVGTSDPGPAEPLDAIRTALTSTELVRTNAYLAVVTVAASDDASPAFDYVHFLKSVKSDPASVLVMGIYSKPSANLDAFFQSFPNRATTVSIDSASYEDAFASLTIRRYSGGIPCFESTLLDVDPDAPGLQVECNVSAWDDDVEIARVPTCQSSTAPSDGSCWQVATDPNCTTGLHQSFLMRGAWEMYHPEIRIECVTAP
jgi:hypothetical protein